MYIKFLHKDLIIFYKDFRSHYFLANPDLATSISTIWFRMRPDHKIMGLAALDSFMLITMNCRIGLPGADDCELSAREFTVAKDFVC